jgi:hypothetical protein
MGSQTVLSREHRRFDGLQLLWCNGLISGFLEEIQCCLHGLSQGFALCIMQPAARIKGGLEKHLHVFPIAVASATRRCT